MRLAIPSTFPPYRGGIAQFNAALADALRAAGHDVVCVNWARQYPAAWFPGIAPEEDEASEVDGPPRLLDSVWPGTWKASAQALVEEGIPDAVLVPFWTAALGPALTGVVRNVRKAGVHAQRIPRCIGLIHNVAGPDDEGWERYLCRQFLRGLDRAIVLSDEVADRVRELRPELPVDVLFHPIYDHFPDRMESAEARRILHLPPPGSGRVLLYFGSIVASKGLDVLIEAMAQVPEDVHLLVAGECFDDWDDYAAAIEDSPAALRIQVHPRYIEDHEVALFFGAADAVALPYRKAATSGVTALAVHYGLPVVASGVRDAQEFIEDGVTGACVRPAGDPAAFAEGIRRLFLQPPPSPDAFTPTRERRSWATFVQKLDPVLSATPVAGQ